MEQSPDRNIWDRVLGKIESRVNAHSFRTWFRPTQLVSEDASTLRIRVPNSWFAEWLKTNYLGVIQDILREIERAELAVQFVHDRDADTSRPNAETLAASAPRGSSRPTTALPAPVPTRFRDGSIRATRSTSSSSRPAISSRTPRRSRSPSSRRAPTTRFTSTAAWGWERRT